jgi:hypothetical protein
MIFKMQNGFLENSEIENFNNPQNFEKKKTVEQHKLSICGRSIVLVKA